MESQEAPVILPKRPVMTPKALIHQKFGTKACYRIEEVKQQVENGCPGLAIPQKAPNLYRCHLDLPNLSVASDIYPRKKDAEQSAAKIAIEKLGIEPAGDNPSPQEAWNELVSRVAVLFTDEFLSSSHPLIGHIRVAFLTAREHFGMIPIAAVAACDVKTINLCKFINSKTVTDPLLVSLLILYAARKSVSVSTTDKELWIWRKGQHCPEIVESVIKKDKTECRQIKVVCIPCSIQDSVQELALDISDKNCYIDEIAKKLNVRDSSQILVSRTVGKSSSDMKLYFPFPEVTNLDSTLDAIIPRLDVKVEGTLNERASYFSGQKIYGDAILANVGYQWKSLDLSSEDVSLCTYYRMLICKEPDGYFKLSREAILATELPTAYVGRANWKGPTPKDLLCFFCRQHMLSEPLFHVITLDSPSGQSATQKISDLNSTEEATAEIGVSANVKHRKLNVSQIYQCQVKIVSKKLEPIVECCFADTYSKEYDSIQNSALKVLIWFNKCFKRQVDDSDLSSFGHSHGINVHAEAFSQEFATSIYLTDNRLNHQERKDSFLGSLHCNQQEGIHDYGLELQNVEDSGSGVSSTPGSLACISYAVVLVRKGDNMKYSLESVENFEFEIGSGTVINQLEVCISQMSVDQVAHFTTDVPSRHFILAAAGESIRSLSELPFYNCFLEYTVRLLRIVEPLEDRMEQAFFSPPLSKQRVEFAVLHINKSHATSLVDFGCGSGSLIDSLLEHNTTLERIIGVDISRKALARAAKIVHQKLSTNNMASASIKSAVLYDGSILDFDSRLYGIDIGTCLEVIEHMEEHQACEFGDVVLNYFCPRVLIVSTPNYEYNTILQRSSAQDKEDDPNGEKSAPCKFRNHDHKFEWTRQQFECWATDLASRHNYSVEFSGVGGSGDIEPGFASQIAVFRRKNLHPTEDINLNNEPTQRYEIIWSWPSDQEICT